MADLPLQIFYAGSASVYAILRRDVDGYVYSTATTAFEVWTNGNIANYAITLTSNGGGDYSAACPTTLVGGTSYSPSFYQTASSPAVGDLRLGGYQFSSGASSNSGNSGPYLCTLADLKTMLGITDTSQDAYLAMALTAATSAIQSYCDQTFFQGTYTEVLDGNAVGLNSGWLEVSERPVQSLTSVTYNPDDSTISTTYTGSNFHYDPNTGFIRWLSSSTSGRAFDYGFRKLAVIYSAGYSSIPSDLSVACASVAAGLYPTMKRDPTLSGERIGDYSYRLGSQANIQSSNPGSMSYQLNQVKVILAKYRRTPAM